MAVTVGDQPYTLTEAADALSSAHPTPVRLGLIVCFNGSGADDSFIVVNDTGKELVNAIVPAGDQREFGFPRAYVSDVVIDTIPATSTVSVYEWSE